MEDDMIEVGLKNLLVGEKLNRKEMLCERIMVDPQAVGKVLIVFRF